MKKIISVVILSLFLISNVIAENGYKLWMNYKPIVNQEMLNSYNSRIQSIVCLENSETAKIAVKELQDALSILIGTNLTCSNVLGNKASILLAKEDNLANAKSLVTDNDFDIIGVEGFIIKSGNLNGKSIILITAKSDIGLLYGAYHLIRLVQNETNIENLSVTSNPKIQVRILNHWDNLDRTVERGYSGFSIWDWHRLPNYIDPRYIDYARANASIGINGTALTNVNSNALVLTPMYLEKVKVLADVFRPYGIKVYLTARFSAPMEIGGLETADPLNTQVIEWWNKKVEEIYTYVPDFGGFLVKANSEGQPGPQDYKRTHADGANLLAKALEPRGGIVMWRAFVYSNLDPTDRAKQAVNEFKPLDGKFHENVLIQSKNGAIDFQPREPFHPLFGSMPETPLAMEFQITQEYLGQGTQLVYLAPLYKECLEADTYVKGKGSTVAKVIDGSLDNHSISGIAGVANIGNDINWTGHLFGQANWYAYGRLAWDYDLTSKEIAVEWIKQTLSRDANVVNTISDIMLDSRETCVNYMTPLGLHHIMGWDHHYGPSPWIKDKPRPEWTSVYYHKADSTGIGFDRTKTGSNAVAQYHPEAAKVFENLDQCPEKFLLWFHHLDWDYKVESGNTLWNEIALRYQAGVNSVEGYQKKWDSIKNSIDSEKFNHVKMMLGIQLEEAKWWRDACLSYFQTFSNRELPEGVEKPAHSLEYYENLKFPYAPGIKPHW